MSYKVLARKWRPQHFSEMLGQEPVMRALINALDTDRLHHAYLFTGMRGVGKTTIARIFAKCLNCLEKGVSSAPCGKCTACKDIEAGRFLDLIEVDAASRTKVDETRELLENVPYAPASGRFKVYLIDEVHMFSNASFNALLKTLEEPPEHVKFLLATTDPQKVPVTVLSRCLQFNLRRMAPDALSGYLGKILSDEGIEAEPEALDLISRASEGSVRDSLSLVEQAAAFGQGAVRVSEVEAMLGRVSTQRLIGLLDALGHKDPPTLFARVEELASYAPDFSEILGEILGLLHRLALLQSVPGTADPSIPGHEALAQLSELVSPEEVQLWYQIGLHARRDLSFSPDPREAFDMSLLRMHGFRPQAISSVGHAGHALADNAPAESIGGREVLPSAKPKASSQARVRFDDGPTESASAQSVAQASLAPTEGLPVRGSVSAGDARDARTQALAALNESSPEPPPFAPSSALDAARSPGMAASGFVSVSSQSPVTTTAAVSATRDGQDTASSESAKGSLQNLTADNWAAVVDELGVSGMPRQLAANSVVRGVDGSTLHLMLEAGQDHLNSPRFAERLVQAVSAWAGESVNILVSLSDQSGATLNTPSRRDSQNEASALEAARASIEGDQRLARLLDDIDGTIDPANVRPLTPEPDASS